MGKEPVNLRSIGEIAAGFLLVFLGILFLVGFGFDALDLITDAIFVGFGIMFLRRGYIHWNGSSSSSKKNEQNRRAKVRTR
jgi:hypothetical protein